MFGTEPQEAGEMTQWAVRLGVPESSTIIDTEARNTYENAIGGQTASRTFRDNPDKLSQPPATRRPRVHETGIPCHASPLRVCFTKPAAGELGRDRFV